MYPGSFDPIHLGHLAIIDYAARAFDEVVVAVLANPDKTSGMFSPSERVELVSAATAHLNTVRCRHFYGLTVDLAEAESADVLIRSAHKEHGFEQSMAATNQHMAKIPAVYARVDGHTRTISASQVRHSWKPISYRQPANSYPQPSALPSRKDRQSEGPSPLGETGRGLQAGNLSRTADQRVPLRIRTDAAMCLPPTRRIDGSVVRPGSA